MIPYLPNDESTPFPDVSTALSEPDGLLAAGGNLQPKRLLQAYRKGIFPWYSEGEPILWWAPSKRAVLFPKEVHISKSMHKVLKKNIFEITHNQAFADVVSACAAPRSQDSGTWITPEMRMAYIELFNMGHARSLECWSDGTLVGGIYGVQLGSVFFGESMFSQQANASKVALITIAQQPDVQLVDCQLPNPHLTTMGMRMIPRQAFIDLLDQLTV